MQLYEDRRALHRIAELGMDLPQTTAYVTQALADCGCRVFHPIKSAVCGFFDFGADSAIAFRADMDGLPMTEKTGLPFASRQEGVMHACGHDGHMAILLELARRLRGKHLRKNILLIFQPGEEAPGGAKPLCETGILEQYRVEAVFGLHLWPGLEQGAIYSRSGALMSRSSEVTVRVTGKSAHIGKAAQGKDALAACVQFYSRAVEMERQMDPGVFRLLKFGHMESGTVRNVIAASARLEGSLRTFDDGVFDAMKNRLYEIAAQVETDTGCAVSIHMSEGYPALCNDEALLEKLQRIVPIRLLEEPSVTSEDFSFYLHRVPGLFCFLGTGDSPALHTAEFDFDETVLLSGAALFETIALEYL